MSQIPIIGQKPQLPPVVITGGFLPGSDKVFLQYAPIGIMEIEEAERIVEGLTVAIQVAKQQRAAVAAVQGNGTGGGVSVS
jgi:hypothetical protein